VTLEPGIHDPEEAPWWEFTCADEVTTAQWMRQAARTFAVKLSGEEDCDVRVIYTSLDGMTGHYLITDGGEVVMRDENGLEMSLIVTRGASVTKEKAHG